MRLGARPVANFSPVKQVNINVPWHWIALAVVGSRAGLYVAMPEI
jgi:hypothetical protein